MNLIALLLSIIICVCSDNASHFYPAEVADGNGDLLKFWLLAGVGLGGLQYISWLAKVIGYRYDRVTRV